MSRSTSCRMLCALYLGLAGILLVWPRALWAAGPASEEGSIPYLAANINTNRSDSNPQYLTMLAGELYFSATANGETELWRYTPYTGVLTKLDVVRGRGSSSPAGLTVLGDALYFTVLRGDVADLWRYHPQHNVLTQLIEASPQMDVGVVPNMLAALEGALYFAFRDDLSRQIRRYTPETDGFSQVPVENVSFAEMAVAGNALYVADYGADSQGQQAIIWRHQPATNSTTKLPTQALGLSYISHLVDVQGELYFLAYQNEMRKLWRYDAAANQLLAMLLNPSNLLEEVGVLLALGSDLYFMGATGYGPIMRYRPANNQLSSIEINPGGPASQGCLTPVGDALYFGGTNGSGFHFWRYDPATEGLTQLAVAPALPHPITPAYGPGCVAQVGADIYFRASVNHSIQLVRYPPGGQEQQNIRINPADGSSEPSQLTPVAGQLYFTARSDVIEGLWHYDPSTGNYAEIVVNPVDHASIHGLTELSGQLYFRAKVDEDTELWRYDPAQAQLHKIDLLVDGSGAPYWLTVLEGDLYFVAGPSGEQAIWRYQPGAGTAVKLASLPRWGLPGLRRMVEAGGLLFFLLETPAGSELWRFNPLDNQVASINYKASGLDGIYGSLVGFGNMLCMSAYASGPSSEVQLWCYATDSGEFRQVSGPVGEQLLYPQNMVVMGNTLYFTVDNPQRKLHRYDLNAPAATAVAPTANLLWSITEPPLVHGDALYFGATQHDKRELWRYWPEEDHLEQLQIRPGAASADPGGLAVLDGVLYFAAYGDEQHGRELWALPLGEAAIERQLFLPRMR